MVLAMPRFLKHSFIFVLSAMAFAFLMLNVVSHLQGGHWDFSKDGTDWKLLNVCGGSFMFVYVEADAPPRLSSLSARTNYNFCLVAYRMYAVRNPAMRSLV